MTTPLLLLVQHALPLHIQAIPHVAQLVNDFILPSTVDAAVYSDLQRVLSVFEGFRPYTVGAMDGAAANGRLDIVQRLHFTRDEGCSATSFIGAASNGHLEVLRWLYQFYPELPRGLQELTEATTHGHVHVVEFLLRNWHLQRSELNSLLVTAAANGHVPVVRVFRQITVGGGGALVAAAANGHVPVMQFLLESGAIWTIGALEKALEGGHIGAIELLVRTGNSFYIESTFRRVAAAISADTMRAVLERCQLPETLIGDVLVAAAENNNTDLVKVLLGKCPPMDTSGFQQVLGGIRFTHPIQVAVTRAMIRAADAGHLGVLRVLLGILTKKSALYARDILNHAVVIGQREVQRLLLELWEENYLRNPQMAPAITIMLEQAAANDDLGTLQQIFTKCGQVNLGDALGAAVRNNSVRVVSLLVEKSGRHCVVRALYDAATKGKAEMVQAVLNHSDHATIENVLQQTISSGDTDISTMLLSKCDLNAHKRIFQCAATSGSVGVLQLLLDQMEPCNIHRALISAAVRGHTEVVASLLDRSDSSAIACALELAVVESRLSVVKLLRHHCDSSSIRNAVAKAQVVGYDEVVQLLNCKKARLK